MMARSGSVRRWLEELRYETETYDPQLQLQQQQEGSVAWRYARVTWSPETAVIATQNVGNPSGETVKISEKNSEIRVKDMPSNRVESIANKVRDVVAKKEENHSDEQEIMRSRLQTISITPGTVSSRRLNFASSSLIPPQSPDLILRRKPTLPNISITARPLSHQQPKQTSYLHRDHQPAPLPSIIKEGPISKVKLMTGGAKSPKNWKTGMHAILTDRSLFFEDADSLLQMKSGAISNSSRERIVDLRDGARITQDTDRSHSSKRNVLAINNKDGSVVVLIQNDEQLQSDSWFRDISTVIAKHVCDNLSRSGSGATNTKSKLNWFFKKRPNKETLVNQGIYKNEPIFGNTLERLYDASDKKRAVPAFVRRCTEILENPPHVFSIGLYRTSGNLSHIQKLRLRVDQEDAEALDDLSIAADSDVLAGALKLFFRELQCPLVPYSIYLKLSEACTNSDLDKRFSQSKDALKKLPEPHLQTLAVLCRHLLRITVYERQNQMSAANLGIVWGPSFTWPDEGTGTRALHLCTDVNRVVHYLIEESAKLF